MFRSLTSPLRVLGSIMVLIGFLGSAVRAGDITEKAVLEEEKDLTFSLSAGYDSEYVFRGVSYAPDLSWTQAEFDYAFSDVVNLWVAGWFATDSSGDFSEVDYMAELGMSFTKFYLGVGINTYTYPATGDADEFELAMNVEYYLGESPFSLISRLYYQPELDAVFWNGGIKLGADLTECIGIEASATIGYNKRYYIENSDWNNVDCRLALPVSVTKKLTIAPYAAISIPLAALDDQDLPLISYGGVSATMSF